MRTPPTTLEESNYPRADAAPKPFYCAPRFLAKAALPMFVLLCVCWGVLYLLNPSPVSLRTVGQNALLFVLCILIVFVCNPSWFVSTSPAGLKSYNGLGVYAVIPWEELQYVGAINLLGLKYFRFKGGGIHWAILVPLDLDSPEDFLAQAVRFLGESHPLTLSLQSAWNATPLALAGLENPVDPPSAPQDGQ